MGIETAIVAGIAILIGTVLQRLSGTGVGLVVAPVLAVLMGPVVGILVTNATTIMSGFLIMLSVRREVEWRRFVLMLPGIVTGAAVASVVVRAAPQSWLQILIGAVVLIAMATTFGLPNMRVITSQALGPASGLVGGFFNTCAGVSAPVMVIYAKLSDWNQRGFAGTMQPTFTTMGIVSVAAKIGFGAAPASGLPPWWTFGIIAAIVIVGIGIGIGLSKRMSSHAAHNVAITLAGLGGATAIIRGILTL